MAEFVLGCVQLGLSYGAANRTGKPSRESALALLRDAADSGICQFDTAHAYGDAEERMGEALSGRDVFVVTKLSPLSELSPDAPTETAVAAVDASIGDSRKALGLERLDCLLLHRCAHMTACGGAIWQRLLEYRDEGTIGRLGVSVQTPAEALQALASPDVEHIQLPFNVLDWRWRESDALAAINMRRGLTVHARSVFLQGLLAAGDPAFWPSIDGVDAAAVLTVLRTLAKELDRESLVDLCLAYANGQNFIDGVVIGQETREQLDANLRLWRNRPLGSDECALVEARVPQLPEQLLNPALWPKR